MSFSKDVTMDSRPVQSGGRLLINVVEERANTTPHQLFASLPKATDPREGFQDIDYGLLRCAVDRTAAFLDERIGKATKFETFAWVGPPTDFRYILIALAAMKTGHRAYFPSPRNSLEAHLSLLDQCDCQAILHAEEMPFPLLNDILGMRPMQQVRVPSLDHLLFGRDGQDDATPYLFDKSFEEARFDPCMVLHTSGSTGIPKAITIKHGYFSTIDAYHDLPRLGAGEFALSPLADNQRAALVIDHCHKAFMSFPNFHAAALTIKLGFSVFFESPMISPPDGPLTADTAAAFHKYADVHASFLPPSILRDMMRDSEAAESLGEVKYVCYGKPTRRATAKIVYEILSLQGGAPLPDDVAQALGDKAHFINCLGVTEASVLPIEATAPKDLQYFNFGPNTGIRFDAISRHQYESVIVRSKELDLLQGIFVTFPELEEWPTKDLWSKHPTVPDHWFYEGRADDIIVFSNGEKLNPLTMEQMIESHPDVGSALVAGSGRFQSSLLVEPREPLQDPSQEKDFLDTIWSKVEQANSMAVAHGKIDKPFMLVASPDKPFLRAGKGSVQRKLTINQYAEKLDTLYQSIENANGSVSDNISKMDFSNFNESKISLRRALQQLGANIDLDDADVFASGLDSLQTINLSRRISSVNPGISISPRVIYANPTINTLARVVAEQGATQHAISPASRSQQMQALLNEFSTDLPVEVRSRLGNPPAYTVLLTGSTGSLGSYLLDALLQDPHVAKIVCWNRSANAADRQRSLHRARGLQLDFESVEFVQGDTASGYLGLNDTTYRRLLRSVTHVLHNAWPVDFNLSLPSFVPHIAFTRRLINFAAQSAHGAYFYFISTIGVTQGHNADEVISERVIEDWSTSPPMGYAESKHIGERLVARAAQLGVSTSICRVGQIAGPVLHGKQGQWPKWEWLPSLIASSLHMGQIPSTIGMAEVVDWLPVDVLGLAIVELFLCSPRSTAHFESSEDDRRTLRVHHAVSPQKTSWSTLLPAILAKLPNDRQPKIVSFDEWVDGLLAANGSHQDADPAAELPQNPAIKLIDFFKSLRTSSAAGKVKKLSTLDVKQAVSQSRALGKCKPVDEQWMSLWMDQWKFS